MKRNRLPALLMFVLLVAGCKKGEPSVTPVARLDNTTLTLEEIRGQLDSSRGVSAAQLNEYLQRWINDEILYREAVRRGLDQKASVSARLEEVRRQLAINALLDDVIYTQQSSRSTPQEVSQYYQSHNNEFLLSGDVALVSFVLFRDRDAANAFRARVLQGTRWGDALKQALADPQQAAVIAVHVDSVYYTHNTLFPVELWRVASASGKVEPSFPIRTGDGFYVLIVWRLSRPGQRADLAYVEREIQSRLAIERRQRLLAELMENLRGKHTVEILVSAGDTAAMKYVK